MKGTILILTTLLLAGCSQNKSEKQSKTTLFVSIPPQVGILKALIAENVDVRALVGEGQSPHSYEPTARQLAALANAEILFTIGVPFEQSLLKKIHPLYPDLQIVETDAQMTKRSIVDGQVCTDCTHNHGAPDPHVWLRADHAAIIAENMFQALEKINLADRVKYEAFLQTLDELQLETAKKLAPYKGQRFYVFHPSFGYFADQYGLVQVPIELEGKSPSPRQLTDMIEMAQEDGVRVIFVQKQFPMESGQTIADAIGGSVLQLDPLAEDVVANLRQIADAISSSYE